MKKLFVKTYQDIISIQNLLEAWKEFVKGKRGKRDVQQFSLNLYDNIFELHNNLANERYQHGTYSDFYITDPKLRHIHKASVSDRLLHHALHRQLYPFFDNTFIVDSYSCRIEKGMHKALDRFRTFSYKVSKNNTKTCWILKCDIEKFFENIDHRVLLKILYEYVPDKNTIGLLKKVIRSFEARKGKGLPLGNLTSQFFVNVYMNEFDQYIKHTVRAKYYIRYADDFLIFSQNRGWLIEQISVLQNFLNRKLRLNLHPKKIFLKTLSSGIDFLGWVHFFDHRILRTVSRKRMFKRIMGHPEHETLQSYLGLLQHGNTYKVRKEALDSYWLSS